MNKELKKYYSNFPFQDYEDFNAIVFTVFREDGKYNLMIDTLYVNEEKDYQTEYGYTVRTTIYTDNLVDMASKVQAILDLGMYDNLIFMPESNCFESEGLSSYNFDWNDYFASNATLN